MTRRLNVGCGPAPAPGWTNTDAVAWGAAAIDHVGRVEDGLPWADGWFDYCVSNHVLQMVAWPDLVPHLTELRRVTRDYGIVRLILPNMAAAMYAYRIGDRSFFPIADAVESSLDGKLAAWITQCGATRTVFTPAYAVEVMHRAGYRLVDCVAYGQTYGDRGVVELDSRRGESLIVEGVA